MKKLAGLLLVGALLFIPAAPSSAAGRHFGGRGGGFHGAYHGGWGGGYRGGWHGSYRGGWHGHWRGGIVIGSPWWWGYGAPFWGEYPYPYAYYPPAYSSPPADQGPSVYIEPPPETQQPQGYWYYCASAKAYYPDVATCPEAWIKVPPAPQ